MHFWIIGYGKMEDEIKRFFKEKNLERFVSVFYAPNPKDWLKQSKVFLSLQLKENYPSQSLIEAMACSNYTIATDVGLTHQLVNEKTGKRVAPHPIKIGDAILAGFADMDKLETTGMNARSHVMQTHSVENYYSYVKSFLEK